MRRKRLRLIPKTLRAKSSLAIILTAAVLVELTNGVQFLFAKRGIQNEVEQRAKSELKAKSLEIENLTTAVEVVVDNLVWAVEAELDSPDKIPDITRLLLEKLFKFINQNNLKILYKYEYNRYINNRK